MDPTKGTEFQEEITTGRTGALSAYRRVTYGEGGLLGFLVFELLTSLLGPLPGALGIFLRKILYKSIIGRFGSGSVIGRNVTLRHPHKIVIGNHVVIDDTVVLDAKGDADTVIRIGDGAVLTRGTVISCKGGSITIGERANFSHGCIVHANAPVVIGNHCLLAAGCYLVGVANHPFDRIDIPMMTQRSTARGIVLEDDVWLGAKVVVLDGVTVEKGSVVGACSLVNASLPALSIAVGCPARVIKKRDGS